MSTKSKTDSEFYYEKNSGQFARLVINIYFSWSSFFSEIYLPSFYVVKDINLQTSKKLPV